MSCDLGESSIPSILHDFFLSSFPFYSSHLLFSLACFPVFGMFFRIPICSPEVLFFFKSWAAIIRVVATPPAKVKQATQGALPIITPLLLLIIIILVQKTLLLHRLGSLQGT